jgi:PAS domain S-box-containing protein
MVPAAARGRTPMNELGSAVDFLRDPRIAAHATSPLPAWLWSPDGGRILWTNAVGAALFDAPSPAALIGRPMAPGHPIAAQIVNLAGPMLPGSPARLARLRGLPIGFGRLLTCTCARIALTDRQSAILIAAIEPAGPEISFDERLRRLLAGIDAPVALFSADGALLHASPAAETRLAGNLTLSVLGADSIAEQALASGHASVGGITVDRLGTGDEIALMVSFAPQPAAPAEPSPHPAQPSKQDQPAPPDRRPPLRFVWQMDSEGRFTLGSNEFTDAIGPRTATALGRSWPEIAAALGLDPEGQIARAMAHRESWSSITITWPVDGTDERIAVEMSGFPIFDHHRLFSGYRGFGICRDVARLADLTRAHRAAPVAPAPKPPPPAAEPPKPAAKIETPAAPEAAPPEKAPPPREERPALTVVPPSKNVVPFRSAAPAPGLSAVERKAFHEIARQLTSRLGITGVETPPFTAAEVPTQPSEAASSEWTVERALGPEPPAPAAAPPSAAPAEESNILDRLPVGVLLYRHNQLIYANRAFLDWTGYGTLDALAQAGGVDRLFSEPGLDILPETGAKALAITKNTGEQLPVEARLFAIPWERETVLALVLLLAPPQIDERQKTAELSLRRSEAEIRELVAILDTATDGVIVLNREGHVLTGNRSAEALFGYDSHEISGLALADLFAPESQRTALDYFDGLTRAGVASVLNDGREVIGRVRQGGLIPLFMTMGRIGEDGEKFCAVFRDITQWKKAEEELLEAKRQAERTSSAKSEFLAKISHEIRTPLNSIIGFSEVMMEERFGPIKNERYLQYIKDIHASGGHVMSLLNDLLDLSKIEAGKLELMFARVDLNAQVQQCVALMQPQANRERIIIRTSLAPSLPQVVADARSVRQIVLNLLSNSIKFTGAGGQVIVSTALSEAGEVVLRVRDTGAGMSDKEIEMALEPFRQLATSTRAGSGATLLGLPLSKALAEANRASFAIRSGVNAGTLVEVAFPPSRVLAA